MNAKEMLLSDAIETAIESEKVVVKQRKIIEILSILNFGLAIALIVFAIGG